MTAVLQSDRPVSAVFELYLDQVRDQANEVRPRVTRGKAGAADVAVVNGDYTTVNVVSSDDGTWVLAEECFGY